MSIDFQTSCTPILAYAEDVVLTRSLPPRGKILDCPPNHYQHLSIWLRIVWGFAILGGLVLSGLACKPQAKSSSAVAPLPVAPKIESHQADSPIAFRTVAGIDFLYQNGEESNEYIFVESLGGGVAAMDYDRDGQVDLFFPGGGKIVSQQPLVGLPGSLWLGRGSLKFENRTESAGCHLAKYYSHGAHSADFDNDGFPDLLVTGYGGLQWFVNQGDGTFQEVAEKHALVETEWSSSAGFGDLDGDGSLDLYVAHYTDWSWQKNPVCHSHGRRDTCAPSNFNGLKDTLYFSNGQGGFQADRPETGLVPAGKGLGVILADFNLDSKLDIYVANDTTNNFLYVNQGHGILKERGLESGTALDDRGIANGSMGLAAFDFDNDLRPDLWVTNFENETFGLYHNDGDNNFRSITSTTGLTALGTLFVGFGTMAGDFDTDGDEDLVITNGHVLRHASTVQQEPLLLINTGQGKLVRQKWAPPGYFASSWRGRGLIAPDLDGDGDLDLVFSHTNQPVAVLENTTTPRGNWIALDLIGTQSNRDAIGSFAIVRTNKHQYLRQVVGGGSYLSQNTYRLHWGIPADEILESVQVTWPNGDTTSIQSPLPGKVHRVIQQMKSTL